MKHSHGGHRDRLKKRMLKHGLSTFEPHNVLELLLFFGVPQKDTNNIAHDLMNKFGALSGVLDAPYESLLKVDGVGEHTATLLKMIPQISSFYMDDRSSVTEILDDPEKIGNYLKSKFIGRTTECVIALALDNKYKAINCVNLFEGSVNAAAVTVKKVAEFAINSNCTNIVLAHNHPYSVALPSSDDLTTTRIMSDGLSAVGIRLLDHIIVADNDFISLARSGGLSDVLK